MPRVPELSLPSVAANNAPSVRQDSAISADALSMPSRQLSSFGSAVEGLGQEMARQQIDAQEMANQVRLNDAKNQYLSQQNKLTNNTDEKQGDLGYSTYKGKAALQPDANGQPLDTVFSEKMRSHAAEISASLGNDAQRRAFEMYASSANTQFQNNIRHHMLEQSNVYTRETNNGTIQLAQDTAAMSWNNPDVVKQQVDSARAAAWHQSTHDGIDGAAQTMMIKESESSIHRKVIEAALENNNAQYALSYKEQNKSGMTAKDILGVEGRLNHQVNASIVQTATNDTVKYFSTKIAPTSFDAAFGVVIGMESGGRQTDKNGMPLTSSAGAIGIAQVMPKTAPEAAKLAGLPFDEQRFKTDAEYNKALGRAYFAKQVETFGDFAKAMAAYNAGPGAVEKAMKKDPQNWLSLLPKETQDYVQKGTSKFSVGSGTPAFPTKAEFVSNAMERLPVQNNPELTKMMRDNAEHQYGLLEQAKKQQGDDALHAVQKALVANGGNYSALPAALVSNLVQRAPEKVDDAIKFAKVLSTKEDIHSDPVAYFHVVNNLGNGGDKDISKMSDAEWFNMRQVLSVKDFETFSKERAAQINGVVSGKDDPANVNNADFKSALNWRLASIGVDAHVKNGDVKNASRIGAIQQFAAEWVRKDQISNGKRFNQEETQKSLDRMFSTSVEFKNTFLGMDFGNTSKKLLELKIGDIPSDARDGIRSQLIKNGNRNPTDQEVLTTYWRLHARR